MKKSNVFPALMITIIIIKTAISQPDCSPCRCVADTTYGGVKAICSHLKLNRIPQSIPWNTTTLLMKDNKLNNQSLTAFHTLENLRNLDLSMNIFYKIDDNAFTGLNKLEVLLLEGNYLYSEGIKCKQWLFDPRFLKPLISLKNISLLIETYSCSFNVTYECSSCPDTLNVLKIDCESCLFGPTFLKLRRLTKLSLNYVCKIPVLDKYVFQHTPYLEILNISRCFVRHVKPGMFDSLQKLRILHLKIILEFGDEFQAFMEVTKSLQVSPLEYISFTSHRTLQSSPGMFSHLQNTSLRELHISCANSPRLLKEIFSQLPLSLVVLSLINIQYDSILTQIRDHPSLKTLELSNLVKSDTRHDDFRFHNLSPILESYICRNCPLIRYGFTGMLRNMKHFIMPDNQNTYFNIYMLRGLPSVEYIDLRNNPIRQIRFLSNSVTYLNLAGNHLGYSRTGHFSLQSNLTNLETLDVSSNGITLVSNNAFDNLRRVKRIDLSNNDIQIINVSLINLNRLGVLDLHNNKISAIGTATRKAIARLPRAKLHLEGNPLICGCEELDSLMWMKQNINQIHNVKSLKCRISGKYKSLDKLDQIIDSLQSNCKSHIVEISVSVCVTVSVITIAVCVLLHRHRWKLRYLYYDGRRGYRQRYNREQVNPVEYEYDAFVSYDENDRRFVIDVMMPELEEKLGLKLCIHQRDFLPGEVISENIVSAIQNSRKTIVVLSPNFLESTWCEFEFNMARMEGVTRRQDVVLVLMYKEVPMMKLSKDLATMLKRKCYLEYDHEVFNRELFWTHVQESIQIIRPRD